MTTLPFDTYTFYTELVESGLPEKTADALTKAVENKIFLKKMAGGRMPPAIFFKKI